MSKRLDLLFLLETDTLFHLDFQTGNLFSMPYRVGVYSLMASHDLRKRIHSVVLYTGHEKLSMKDHVDTGDVQVRYRLIDIREFDSEMLLLSDRPGDNVLALLARGGAGKLRRILEKLGKLPGPQRDRALAQLAILSGLRRMSGRFTWS